jgi:outer membrane protein OmpA-like peptidoglycan-associated protein
MASKIRVYGKAQNRTALGIVNAYLVMYPHATLEDLRKAFPDRLNKWKIKGKDSMMFVSDKEKDLLLSKYGDASVYEENFLSKPEEVLKLQDGTKVAFRMGWTKEDYEAFVNWAKQYDIEVAEFKPGKSFEKGGFVLEYLNGYVPPVPVAKKSKWWLWLLIAATVIIVLAILLMRSCNKKPEVVEKVVTETVVVHDTVTVYLEQIEEIEKNFNAAKFEAGKADLNDDAKFVLHDLVKILNKQPQLRLKIEGHTSDEGDASFNQKLSENRAKAVVDFLISKGIAADRLEYEGKGSTEPIDPNNRELNRRTEIIVLE